MRTPSPCPATLHLLTLAAALVAGCAPPDPLPERRTPAERGERLFTSGLFEGNGRVCATCHVVERFGTLDPTFVQEQFRADPEGPLFRTIDSDDGLGASYGRLLEHATVRVPIDLAVHESIGLAVRRCDAPEVTRVWLHRGNPSIFNIALEQNLMTDGRDGASLETQARNAVATHAEPGRDPRPDELADIASFQRAFFSHEAIRALSNGGPEPELPEGRTPEERRGREFFEPLRQCGVCHAGPLLNETSAEHPDATGLRFESAMVGMEPDNPNPKFEWCWVDPATNRVVEGPNGSTRALPGPAADPGISVIAGAFDERPDGRGGTFGPGYVAADIGPMFKIPTLWGVPQTAPYFHDNSAKTLEEVLDQYNLVFQDGPDFAESLGCDLTREECLDDRDKADIIAFLQLLSFEAAPGLPPGS